MQAASSSLIAGATNDIVSVPAVVRQLRANILVVAGLQLLYLAMEFNGDPGLARQLLKLHTINLGLLGLAFVLTFSELFARHWRAVTLIFCALLLSVGTAISVIGRVPEIYLASLVLFSMGCAVFVPWETSWQAALNLLCLAAFLIEDALTPPADEYWIQRLSGLALLMLAQLAARMVGGYRESLYSQIESIRKAEAKLRAVLNSAPDAMIVADGDGTITMANPQTGKLFGYDPAELLGRSVETLIPDRFRRNHPLDRAEYLANPHHARRMADAVEVRALRKDGTEFPVEINLSPVEGHPGGAVTCAIRDVTARKRAEEAIRQSEEKFRKIFNGSIDAIAVNSLADAKYLDINEGYLKLIGYSREEVLGRTPKELKIWANHAERVTASKELRTKGFIHNFEGEFVTKDGTRRSGLFSAVVVDLPEQPCVISFVRDITERRQAEMAIRRLAAIVESSDDAIASSTLDGTITSWNRGAERLFGYSASEIVGQPTGSFVGSDAWPEFSERLETIGQAGGIYRYDARRLKKDGSPVDISVTLSPIYDAAGAVVGASAIGKDITERKRAEQTRALLASIVQSADEAIYSANLDWKITSWNPGAEKLYGYSTAEVMGRTLDLLLPPERLDETRQLRAKVARGESVQHLESRRLRKDGSVFDASISLSPIYDAAGVVVGASAITKDITEGKRTERELQQSEEKFRKIFDASTEVISINSFADGRYIDVNGEFQKLTGYTREEAIGRTPEELKLWPGVHDLATVMRELRTKGFIRNFESDLFTKSGARRSRLLSAVLINFAEQRCILSFARDITERKQAEQTRSLLAAVVESANDAVFSTNLDLQITSWNPGAERLYGYSAAEIMGQTVQALIPPDRGDEAMRAVASIVRGEGVQRYDTKRVRKDGTLFDASISLSPIYDAAGAITGVAGISRDITERKRGEEERALLAAIIRSADDPILSSDLSWIITSWNPGAQRLYGYSAAEILGQKVDIMVPPDHVAEVEHARVKILRGEGVVPYESKRIRKDRSVIDVSVTLSPIYDATGSLVGISAIHRDITERKLAERARELARSNAELEEFAHIVSHDLREPLHNVASYVQLLAKDYQGKLGADADDYIRYAVDGVHWMHTLIEDLRAYSRATAEKKATEPTDFASVVRQAISNLAAAIGEQKATVTYEPMPTVAADERAIIQVFQNLIENGLKFHGQEPPRVHVGVKRITGGWAFFVRDNGIGIDSEHIQKIFTIFHRLHSRREYPGSGIGLAICKKIVERHGGRIWFESEPGRGTTFYFTIPA